MKKKRKILMIISIIILTICIIPNNVFAEEEKPELKWEKEDIKTDTSYTGTEILCGTDNGYIAVDSNGEIARYNADGEKVNVITVTTDEILYAIIDGDNLVFISGDENYSVYLNKYNLDGNLIYQKEFNGVELVNGNNEYYAITQGDGEGDFISMLDKDGNIIKSVDIGSYFYSFIYDKNSQSIIVLGEETIFKLDANLNILEFKDNAYSKIKIVDDGYILWLEGSNNALAKLNKNFEIVWEINNLSIRINDIAEIEDGYILVGNDNTIQISALLTPKLVKINADGNVLYEETYDKYIPADFYKIITLNNNDYIIYTPVGGNFYSQYSGSVILKYGYKDYNITANIKGEGTIDVSETAKEGDKVTFKVTLANNYELKSIKVVTVSGKVIEVTDNSFIMPDEDVIIEGEFVKTLTSNPETGNIIMLITGIVVILILGTVITLYYKKKNRT